MHLEDNGCFQNSKTLDLVENIPVKKLASSFDDHYPQIFSKQK